MILDDGVCRIVRKVNIAKDGYMPIFREKEIYRGWFGFLSFETAPVWETTGREEARTDARIRILQCRGIGEHDRVILAPLDPETAEVTQEHVYEIRRAYQGDDTESGERITDLTLVRTESEWEEGEPEEETDDGAAADAGPAYGDPEEGGDGG